MFKEDSKVIAKKTIETQKKPKRSKEELQQVLDIKRGATMGSPKSIQKGRTLLKLEKDQNNGGSQEKMLGLRKSCVKVPNQ